MYAQASLFDALLAEDEAPAPPVDPFAAVLAHMVEHGALWYETYSDYERTPFYFDHIDLHKLPHDEFVVFFSRATTRRGTESFTHIVALRSGDEWRLPMGEQWRWWHLPTRKERHHWRTLAGQSHHKAAAEIQASYDREQERQEARHNPRFATLEAMHEAAKEQGATHKSGHIILGNRYDGGYYRTTTEGKVESATARQSSLKDRAYYLGDWHVYDCGDGTMPKYAHPY